VWKDRGIQVLDAGQGAGSDIVEAGDDFGDVFHGWGSSAGVNTLGDVLAS